MSATSFGAVALPSRFWAKVDVLPTGCWEWSGCKVGNGYGQFRSDGKTRLAHRVSYQTLIGPVPEGLDLDHLCRNRACVNPEHLEPVTRAENVRRGDLGERTQCARGHELVGNNVYSFPIASKGGALQRKCAACIRAGKRRKLTESMRGLLWRVAQHKYGWTYVDLRKGGAGSVEALVRRGLVERGEDSSEPLIIATDAGKVEILRRWPVSPFALGTYDHQSGGWTPREGVVPPSTPIANGADDVRWEWPS